MKRVADCDLTARHLREGPRSLHQPHEENMTPKILCTAALLSIASVSFAQSQSNSTIGSGDSANVPNASTATPSGQSPGQGAGTTGNATTGTSTENASTGPTPSDPSVGQSGSSSSTGSTSSSTSDRCGALTGQEKEKCMDEQPSSSTGSGSGSGDNAK
jgi:hypothetical protein